MPISIEDVVALEILDSRIRTILPEEYQDSYEDLMPVSMRSAGLKYGEYGRVAWDKMWATFCDLAMAGGPPHRGALLEPASFENIPERQHRYHNVATEICRGIGLVTGLPAQPSPFPGWVQVQCESEVMAAWLVRAIVMENVLARHEDRLLYLPAGPDFRLEKEIKNVITVAAKTCHYWTGHIPSEQQRSIEKLLMASDAQLLGPGLLEDLRDGGSQYQALLTSIDERISSETHLPCFTHRYVGWIGVECPSVRAAIWIMRAMVSGNVLARREGAVLFVAVNPAADSNGERVVRMFLDTFRLASVRRVF